MGGNVVICGLPGVGKTEAAKLLSLSMGWKHLDTDACIEACYYDRYGKRVPCREIYLCLGESRFRKLEEEAIRPLAELSGTVISTGGGILEQPGNAALLKNLGTVVYLKGTRAVIFQRLKAKGLPAYLDPSQPYASFEIIASRREPLYESIADLQLSTDSLTPEAVAERIGHALKNVRP